MNKRNIGAIITVGFLCFAIGIFSSWLIASVKKHEDIDYLIFIVGLNTIMITIAIALAVYKVVSAKEIKDVVEDYFKKVMDSNKIEIEKMRKKIKEYSNRNIRFLAMSVDTLVIIAQEKAKNVMEEMKITDKPAYRKLAEYVNEMDKELISILYMFILTTSFNPNQRLKGYELLHTIPSKEIQKYFRAKILDEDSERNKRFLIQSLN